MNKKITKKEVNEKKDYVVVNLYHERYSADLDISIHKNKSIIDIYNYYNFAEDFDINKLERAGYHGMGYVYDKCGSYELSDFELTKKELKRFKGYHIEALTIVELDKFIKEESFCTIIMGTNNKWGLVDYAYTPAEMGTNKNIPSKLHWYLYDHSKLYRKIRAGIFSISCKIWKFKNKIRRKFIGGK